MTSTLLLLLCATTNIWLGAAKPLPNQQGLKLPGRGGREGIPGSAGPPGPSGSTGDCKCSCASPVVTKRLLTPRRLQSVASLSNLTSASDTALHFTAGASSARLLSFALDTIGTMPQGTLKNLTINIQVHFLQSPTSTSKPIVALCDGTTCNAIQITDAAEYPNLPCLYSTFAPGPILTDSRLNLNFSPLLCGGETTETTSKHPKTVHLSFVPSERWGSFSIPEGSGFTASDTFGKQLDLTRGLSVEMYSNNGQEQYKLGSILVEVIREE